MDAMMIDPYVYELCLHKLRGGGGLVFLFLFEIVYKIKREQSVYIAINFV